VIFFDYRDHIRAQNCFTIKVLTSFVMKIFYRLKTKYKIFTDDFIDNIQQNQKPNKTWRSLYVSRSLGWFRKCRLSDEVPDKQRLNRISECCAVAINCNENCDTLQLINIEMDSL
jgi:hypothetical protein